jgi:hypothetical protein
VRGIGGAGVGAAKLLVAQGLKPGRYDGAHAKAPMPLVGIWDQWAAKGSGLTAG